jgi:hypothetical protein
VLGVFDADPALANQKPGYALPFGKMLQIVPVVEFVFGGIGKIQCCD